MKIYRKITLLLCALVLLFRGNNLNAQSTNCATATSISLSTGNACVNGTTVGAIPDNTFYGTCNPSPTVINPVWYTYVTNGSNNSFVITPGTLTNTEFILYIGGCPGTPGSSLQTCGTATGSNVLNSTWGLPAGVQVWVGIASKAGTQGTFQLCITSTPPVAAPGNTCSQAIPLCNFNAYTLASMAANSSGQTPNCFLDPAQRDIWYEFTITQAGTLAFKCTPTVTSTEFDWALWDVTAGCPGTVTCCNYHYAGGSTNGFGMQTIANSVACGDQSFLGNANKEYCAPISVTCGKKYALQISNYDNTNKGFSIAWTGSTCMISSNAAFSVNPTLFCGASLAAAITNTSTGTCPGEVWDFGDATANYTGTAPPTHNYTIPGTYAITATIAGTCPSTASQFVKLYGPLAATTTSANATCPASCNGTASVASISGGDGVYTYSWAPGGQTTASVSGLCVGSYTVTISNAVCGTTITKVVTIGSNTNPTVTVNSPTICNGVAATLTANGATSYTWSAGATSTGTNTATASPSATTSYTVTGTTSGCTGTAVSTVTVNPVPVISPISNITACNNSSIAASAFVSTPTGATFTWTNSNTAIGLAASGTGNFASFTATNAGTTPITSTVTVTATLNSCVSVPVSYTITVNPTPTVTVPANIIICNNGTIATTAFTSNVAGATYAWTNSNTAIGIGASGAGNISSFTATNTGATAITATITVTPTANTCPGTPSSYTITVNPTPIVTVNSPTICPTVTANLIANGATSYTWSAGATSTGVNTADASPASTTSYTVTGTSAGCSATAVSTVTVASSLTITVNSPTICNGQTANLTATGGTTYTWSAGATSTGVNTADASPTTLTSYTVTGTTGGCSGTAVSTVTVNSNPTVTVNSPTICNGITANLTANGATSYTWTAGATSTGVNTANASPTGTTSYTVTGTTSGCTGTAVSTVTVNPIPTITVNSPTICPTATANLTANGGTTYTWSAGATSTGVNTATASPASTTSYTVTGTTSGCSATAVSTVTVAGALTVAVNSPTICAGQIANLTATGGTTYTWSAGATSTGVATADASPASTTSYTVTGNTGGCTGTAVSTVTVNANPTVTVNSPTICNGITANLTANGATSYTWTTGATSTGVNTADASPSSTTSYTVTGTTSGCTGTAVSTVTVNPIPTITVNSPTICPTTTANLTANGGTTYVWSAGATSTGVNTADASPVSTTSYTVTGTSLGCSSTAVSTVTVASALVVGVNSPTICNGATANLTATGATSYTWTAGATSTGVNTADASPTTTTSYTVTGTTGGCSGTAVSTVTVNANPIVSVNSPTICNGIIANLTANGATSYTWTAGATSTGINTADASPSSTTSYTVTGTTSGCTGTAVSTVTVNPIPNVTVNSPTICNGSVATLTANGATSYVWTAGATSTGVNTADASPSTTTTYTVTGTTSGCSASATSTVTVNAIPGVGVNSDVICNGSTSTLTAFGATSYTWSAGATVTGTSTADVSPSVTTTYTVTGTTAGCSSSATSTVTVNPIPLVTVNSPSICPGNTANLTAGGATTYAWSAGASPTAVNTADASPAVTTTYTVTGTSTGCSASATSTVTVVPAVVVTVNSPTICNGTTANLTAGGATSYTWSAGVTSTGINTADATPSSTTIYSVTGTVGTCTGSATFTVTVNPIPNVTVNSPSVCKGVTANLTANGATSYSWSAGATSTGINTATATPVATTTYTVTGTSLSCSGTALATVTVNPIPVPAIAPAIPECSPACIQFYDNSTIASPATITSWTWNFGPTETAQTDTNALHCFNGSGTFPITLTVNSINGCSATSAPYNFIVYPSPVAAFTAPQVTSIFDPTVQYTDQSTIATGGTINSWTWNFGDLLAGASNTSALQSPSHTFAETGTYCAHLLVISTPGNCKDSTDMCIVIEPEFTFFIPNAFSPNDDNINEEFYGKGENIKKYEMSIYDRWGNLIFYADDIKKHWDGKVKGGSEIAQVDVYVYSVKLTDLNNKIHKYIGTVTLVK